jgi:hypothetical protein
MAALLLSTVGAAAGGAVFGPVGAVLGRFAGAAVGNMIDQRLFGDHTQRQVEGPRLADLEIMASTEGAPIPRIYGRVRIAGQVIWATKLEEKVTTRDASSGGGKGGGGGGGGGGTTVTTYTYFANIAVGLCEGPIGQVLRVWADGKPLDLSRFDYRVYRGTEDQAADPLIVAKEGTGEAPAYRGLAYIVFERMRLQKFGNRIPQLSFEIVKPVGRLEQMVRAVTLIPGTTEFGYEPETIVRTLGPGKSAPENRHVAHAVSDVEASLDELQAVCPNLERVAIVVAWFGSDLRANHCTLRPGVDSAIKQTHGGDWTVAGLERDEAYVVSTIDGRAAYGGTPSDASVRHLITELGARGIKVTLYPFVVMDIPAGNTLPDPWTGAASQPVYPWRGRITCDPAPGRPGSPDGTSTAGTQISDFFGSGSGDWSYRRMVLHYANLCDAAGGVDAFLIGSELKSLTRVRSASGVYPAVTKLADLAADVRAILGPDTVITYGADWSEYGAHVVDPAANEVRFPLDALWASSSIDAVGLDYYAPLADWRDTAGHLDRAIAASTHDKDYLAGNITGGEGYDWYYADDAARAAQTRSNITDGLGKPWTFRVKDIWNWWSNAHYERVGGIELASPTAWVPEGKPIWLTEVGCPAVNKGANQPSVFPDPKSSEAGLPYFSDGRRDDLIQRRYLEAVLAAFDPAFGATEVSNPISAVYGQRMVVPSGIHLWTWDARPYPSFPAATDVWSDCANWETGHWLTGRFGSAPLDGLLRSMLTEAGIADFKCVELGEPVDGYLLDRPMAPRAAIEPLALTYAFDAVEEETTLRFRPRGGAPVMELNEDHLVLPSAGAPFRLVRAQETELPREVSLGFTDGGYDYRRAAVISRRLVGEAARSAHADLAIVTNDAAAERRAEIWLQDLWAGRESAEFALPPSRLALAPGDVVALTAGGRRRLFELRQIVDTEYRRVRARSIDPEVFDLPLALPRRRKPAPPPAVAPVAAHVLDLPALDTQEPPVLTRIAVFADPWPGAVAVWTSADGLSFKRAALALAPAIVGETLDALPAGPTGRFDNAHTVRVLLYGGVLASATDNLLFGGANVAAVQRADSAWEILQFGNADLVDDLTYKLSHLLRGQAGSEWAVADPLPVGAPFVLLDEQVIDLARGLGALQRPMQLRLVDAARDHGDATALAMEITPQPTALLPLSPAHLRATRTGAGISISWIRRTRGDGDSWAAGEVPLGEASEAYSIDILSGASVVRTINTAGPTALYASADEIADFGTPQSSLNVRIYQLSATVGRGFPADVTLPFLG